MDESSLRFLNRAANVVFKEFADGKISIEKALEIFKKLKVKYNGLFVYTDNFYKNELSTKGLSSDRMERKSNFLKLVARANVNHTISTFSKKLDSEYKKYKLTYVNYLNKFEKQKNSVNNVKELNRAA